MIVQFVKPEPYFANRVLRTERLRVIISRVIVLLGAVVALRFAYQNAMSNDFRLNIKLEPTVASCTDGLLFLFLSTKQNPLKPPHFDLTN